MASVDWEPSNPCRDGRPKPAAAGAVTAASADVLTAGVPATFLTAGLLTAATGPLAAPAELATAPTPVALASFVAHPTAVAPP
jgi:hypothetical protein